MKKYLINKHIKINLGIDQSVLCAIKLPVAKPQCKEINSKNKLLKECLQTCLLFIRPTNRV